MPDVQDTSENIEGLIKTFNDSKLSLATTGVSFAPSSQKPTKDKTTKKSIFRPARRRQSIYNGTVPFEKDEYEIVNGKKSLASRTHLKQLEKSGIQPPSGLTYTVGFYRPVDNYIAKRAEALSKRNKDEAEIIRGNWVRRMLMHVKKRNAWPPKLISGMFFTTGYYYDYYLQKNGKPSLSMADPDSELTGTRNADLGQFRAIRKSSDVSVHDDASGIHQISHEIRKSIRQFKLSLNGDVMRDWDSIPRAKSRDKVDTEVRSNFGSERSKHSKSSKKGKGKSGKTTEIVNGPDASYNRNNEYETNSNASSKRSHRKKNKKSDKSGKESAKYQKTSKFSGKNEFNEDDDDGDSEMASSYGSDTSSKHSKHKKHKKHGKGQKDRKSNGNDKIPLNAFPNVEDEDDEADSEMASSDGSDASSKHSKHRKKKHHKKRTKDKDVFIELDPRNKEIRKSLLNPSKNQVDDDFVQNRHQMKNKTRDQIEFQQLDFTKYSKHRFLVVNLPKEITKHDIKELFPNGELQSLKQQRKQPEKMEATIKFERSGDTATAYNSNRYTKLNGTLMEIQPLLKGKE